MRAIVWFRQDLRIADNAALFQACKDCDEVIPVFIHDNNSQSISQLGSASNTWLHYSLRRLTEDLLAQGSVLILRQGPAKRVLEQLTEETQATHLYWNRCYEPAIRQRDELIKKHFKQTSGKKIKVQSFKGNLLFEPWEIVKDDHAPYRVFTPYWNKLQGIEALQSLPLPAPADIKPMATMPQSVRLEELGLLSKKTNPDWRKPMMSNWQVGEASAMKALDNFLQKSVSCYKKQRDFPAIPATSALSPHLHFGEISPMQIFHNTRLHRANHAANNSGSTPFLREVAWREFAYYLLYHFPETIEQPMNPKFKRFVWSENYQQNLKRWQQGTTGYPIIDAGMRQLWRTGWMHNRVRMIVASFLTKNLLIPWQDGEAWFRETLVDADLASNTMGWQWVAGCGADAAPYFRIFNPVLQSKKFDPDGEYIRRWVTELRHLDKKQIHEPSAEIAMQCNYSLPIVDLKATRQRALERYSQIK